MTVLVRRPVAVVRSRWAVSGVHAHCETAAAAVEAAGCKTALLRMRMAMLRAVSAVAAVGQRASLDAASPPPPPPPPPAGRVRRAADRAASARSRSRCCVRRRRRPPPSSPRGSSHWWVGPEPASSRPSLPPSLPHSLPPPVMLRAPSNKADQITGTSADAKAEPLQAHCAAGSCVGLGVN